MEDNKRAKFAMIGISALFLGLLSWKLFTRSKMSKESSSHHEEKFQKETVQEKSSFREGIVNLEIDDPNGKQALKINHPFADDINVFFIGAMIPGFTTELAVKN